MKIAIIAALLASVAAPAVAQDALTSTSGSDATSNSGSQSGAAAASNQTQGQSANNAGIGNSESHSNSGANANSSTSSGAAAYGNDQGQSQGQSANNSQGQSQGQTTTAQQGNMQGVTVQNQFNSTNRKTNEVRTNNAVPLAASSSFAADYCGGTASGGASASPIGISIGGAAPVFDKSCQSLRRAERFGQAAANASNMGQPELAGKLMAMMIWSICTSDSQGPKADSSTAHACAQAALLGTEQISVPSSKSPPSPPAALTPEPKTVASNGGPTPQAVQKVADDQRSQKVALTVVGH